MKQGDLYNHFREGTEYHFCSMAVPITDFKGRESELEEAGVAFDADTPKGEEPREIKLYNLHGITIIDKDTPHVIYQSEKDYETKKVWGRKADDFFGYKKQDNGTLVKRFVRQERRK